MKIVTWNCNGALRNKFQFIDELKADIYVIQECENPSVVKHDGYKQWSSNYLWIGDSKNKGLGVFAKGSTVLKKLDWNNNFSGHVDNSIPEHKVKHFLACSVNNEFNLLGVWTHKNDSECFGYIGQLWKYLQLNQKKLGDCIIAGDLNSNVVWDKWDRWWNHSNVVEGLKKDGIESLYHLVNNELQGKETTPTLYLQRKLEKPYHIDYIFGSEKWTSSITSCKVGKPSKWLVVSDHMPIIADFRDE